MSESVRMTIEKFVAELVQEALRDEDFKREVLEAGKRAYEEARAAMAAPAKVPRRQRARKRTPRP